MAKHKVKYDRETCIGCMSCVLVCPNNWEEDGEKVKLSKEDIDDDGLAENKEAENICPVDAIKIEEN
tara:strand:- start:298 stop:498 length:201 start_codon:yes stop_codon:yes gene_type:complete